MQRLLESLQAHSMTLKDVTQDIGEGDDDYSRKISRLQFSIPGKQKEIRFIFDRYCEALQNLRHIQTVCCTVCRMMSRCLSRVSIHTLTLECGCHNLMYDDVHTIVMM